MKKLTIQEHDFLTESIIKALAQNRITTISEFLQEDVEKLSIISTLKLSQILDIRSHILLKYSAPLINCTTLKTRTLKHWKFIPTHIESLDAVLEGGIPAACITELCGLAGSGKTQMCLQMAINCATLECSVLYIDTKGDFSAIRLMKMLQMKGNNNEQMAKYMSKIQVVHIWNLKDAIELLKIVKSGIMDKLKLVIIDSLPSLMLQHLGDNNKIGLTLLNELVNNLRFISKELTVAVICVNIQTRWLDQDIGDNDDEDESNLITRDSFIETHNRCLGKYWQYIPSTLLIIEKSDRVRHENKNVYQIKFKVYNSRLPKQFQTCTTILDDTGTIRVI